MTWYYVGLYPGVGVQLDQAVVDAYDEEEAIAKAAKMGCGDVLDPDQYVMYLNSIGVPPEEELDYVDPYYVWIDAYGVDFAGYVNLDNAIERKATPEDMLLLKDIEFDLDTSELLTIAATGIHRAFKTGEDLRREAYRMYYTMWRCPVYDVRINGERYLFGGTLEELLDELMLTDADQIAGGM